MMGKAARYALKGPLAVSEYAMLRIGMRYDNRPPAYQPDSDEADRRTPSGCHAVLTAQV